MAGQPERISKLAEADRGRPRLEAALSVTRRWRGVLEAELAEASGRLVSTWRQCWLRSTSSAASWRLSRAGSVEILRGSGASERRYLARACFGFSGPCPSVHAAVTGLCIRGRRTCSYLLHDLPSVAGRPYRTHAQQLTIEPQRARHGSCRVSRRARSARLWVVTNERTCVGTRI